MLFLPEAFVEEIPSRQIREGSTASAHAENREPQDVIAAMGAAGESIDLSRQQEAYQKLHAEAKKRNSGSVGISHKQGEGSSMESLGATGVM